eukprot:362130-Chlamydomonas_euryale.AAC.4
MEMRGRCWVENSPTIKHRQGRDSGCPYFWHGWEGRRKAGQRQEEEKGRREGRRKSPETDQQAAMAYKDGSLPTPPRHQNT